jgi:peptidoglycan-associated lipoprotein
MKFLNSRNDDFSPAFSSNDYQEVYFTSSRDETTGNTEHGATGQGFADIFFSSMDKKGKWGTPLPLSPAINTESEEGTPSFTADYNTMFFTRCNMNRRKTEGCQIFEATREGTRWTDIKPIPLASDSLVVAPPAISNDGLTLYFVSDMEGSTKTPEGKNSKDIWLVTRASANTDWGSPQNAGSIINTSGDELFPYRHPDGTLYFSSNGHVGMGGLDIFKAVRNEGGQWNVENMKYPVNSSADDFGIVFEKDRESGFFSSARKGRTSSDIYSFVLPPLRFSIAGIVRDEKNDDIIAGAIVKSIGSDGITLETKTGNDGIFRFSLNPGTDYVFISEKKGTLKVRKGNPPKAYHRILSSGQKYIWLLQNRRLKLRTYSLTLTKPTSGQNQWYLLTGSWKRLMIIPMLLSNWLTYRCKGKRRI